MRKKLYVLLLIGFVPSLVEAQLSARVNPTGAAVVITQPSAVFASWIITSADDQPLTVVSEEGLFVLNDQVLGRVGTFLTTTVGPNGTGVATETLLIPPDVSNRAFKLNTGTFFYRRTFRSTTGAIAEAALTCRLSTSAYGNFSIGAVTLFFENQRGEATFEQNLRDARAYAEVHYNGTGLMKAVWEVQEPNSSQFRVLQQVNYHLTYGDRIVFETPSLPPLPTIVSGRHQLRFRIQQPVSGFELPQVSYFVKPAAEPKTEKELIRLIAPANRTTLNDSGDFRWNSSVSGGSILKFSVYEKTTATSVIPDSPSIDATPDESTGSLRASAISEALALKGVEVFSAALPPGAASFKPKPEQLQRLRSGNDYIWQVQILNSAGKVVAESPLFYFRYLR